MTRPSASLKVGQLAALSGKSVRAIRFYEELGLLVPDTRSTGGFRMYSPRAVVRIRWIDRLQELGFSLTDIQDFLSELERSESAPDQMKSLEAFYKAKLQETEEAVARMQGLTRDIKDSIAYLQGCATCAPETPRGHCKACNQPVHEGQPTPDMVAAVTQH